MSSALAPRSSTPNLLGYGRELIFDCHGLVAAGDANGLEVTDIGLENLGYEVTETRIHGLALAPLKGVDPTRPWHLTPEEWGQVAAEDCDGQVDEGFDADADDTVGDAIFIPAPVAEVEDEYSEMAESARRELASLRARRAFQAKAKAEESLLAAAAPSGGGIRPRLSLPSRTQVATRDQKGSPMPATAAARSVPSAQTATPALRLLAPAPRPTPNASARALMARIEDGQKAAVREKSNGAGALLRRALLVGQTRAEELVEQAERMLRACEANPLPAPPAPRPAQARRAPAPPPACFGGGSPNTAGQRSAQLARKRARTDKLNPLAAKSGGSNGKSQQGGKKGK